MKLKAEQIKSIPKLVDEGLKYKTIAKELGVSYSAVRYWVTIMRKGGVEVKSKCGPKPLRFKPDGTILTNIEK